MNSYVKALNKLRDKPVHKLKEIGDQWRTPEWLFWAINELYGPLCLDLFTDGQNSKCPLYFTAEDNALIQDWGTALSKVSPEVTDAKAFANPPYSQKRAAASAKSQHITGMTHIMRKAYEEHLNGTPSVWLVKSATSESWWPHDTVSQIIHITGRIGFEVPYWYDPDIEEKDPSGAGFGASILIFNGEDRLRKPEEYIRREALRAIGDPIAERMAESRAKWVSRFDGL